MYNMKIYIDNKFKKYIVWLQITTLKKAYENWRKKIYITQVQLLLLIDMQK